MQVTVELPDRVARRWGETPAVVGRQLMEDAAIEGYRAGQLSRRQVGKMLGMDYWQTEDFLTERGVPLNYSATDLEASISKSACGGTFHGTQVGKPATQQTGKSALRSDLAAIRTGVFFPSRQSVAGNVVVSVNEKSK